MEDLERLRDLELRLFELKAQKSLIEGREKELRNELKDLIPHKGYKGPFLTMTWRNNQTDWRAVVDMLVDGNKEAIERYAEDYRRPGKVFYITNTPQQRKGRGQIPEVENERLLIENQLEAANDQQHRIEEHKDLVDDYIAKLDEGGGIEDQMLVEWLVEWRNQL